MRTCRHHLLAAGLCALLSLPSLASAQQGRLPPPAPPDLSFNALAPALAGAIMSGDVTATTFAINTFSGGNTQKLAELAEQVALRAPANMTTQPRAAAAAATAAAGLCARTPQASLVPCVAVRMHAVSVIGGIPPANITSLAKLGVSLLEGAPYSNNPAHVYAVGEAVVRLAERLAPVSPVDATNAVTATLARLVAQDVMPFEYAYLMENQIAVRAARLLAAPLPGNAAMLMASAESGVRILTLLARSDRTFAANPSAAMEAIKLAYLAASLAPGGSASARELAGRIAQSAPHRRAYPNVGAEIEALLAGR